MNKLFDEYKSSCIKLQTCGRKSFSESNLYKGDIGSEKEAETAYLICENYRKIRTIPRCDDLIKNRISFLNRCILNYRNKIKITDI